MGDTKKCPVSCNFIFLGVENHFESSKISQGNRVQNPTCCSKGFPITHGEDPQYIEQYSPKLSLINQSIINIYQLHVVYVMLKYH